MIPSGTLIKRQEESFKLPPGHVGRKKAAAAVEEEYRACRAQEKVWLKKLPRKWRRKPYMSPEVARKLLSFLCQEIGERKVPKLVFCSKEVQRGASAHYNYFRKAIHTPFENIHFKTLIHELSHHCNSPEKFGESDHGPSFCEIELLLFEVAEVWLRK